MLPRWRRRVLAYRVIGALPGGEDILDRYKTSFGTLRRLGLEWPDYRIPEMCRLLQGAQVSVEGKDLIEIGAGWEPVLPAVFHGLGARIVVMTDVRRHMRQHLVASTVDYLLLHAAEIAALVGADEPTLRARWTELRPAGHPWVDVWASRGITYQAPLDLQRSRWAPESTDIVYSNSCLNYVPAKILAGIVRETARVLRPGGHALHDISVYDDLTSASMPFWNFLRYDDEEWDRIGNSSIHHQNRLRPRDYAALLSESRMKVVWEERLYQAGAEPELDRADLHPRFRDLPAEEILCKHYLVAATK